MIKAPEGKLTRVSRFWALGEYFQPQSNAKEHEWYLNDQGDILVIRGKAVIRAFSAHTIEVVDFPQDDTQ